jgi:hypothetical protein
MAFVSSFFGAEVKLKVFQSNSPPPPALKQWRHRSVHMLL